jgi:5-methyltetrahydrofolate--homocysteine methyltransferase
VKKREGRPNMCLADFVAEQDDWIGGFTVALHGSSRTSPASRRP